MKKFMLGVIFFALAIQLVFAVPPFVDGYFYPKKIIVGFDNNVVQSKGGLIETNLEDGIIKTEIESFDQLAQEFRFVDLKQMHPFVKDQEWNYHGIYPMNIYQITLERNDNIEHALSALLEESTILYAEYETIYRYRFTPNDPYFEDQWGLPIMECPEAWDYTMGSEEVVVGIVDSGVHWVHEDLKDNIWINQAELDAGMTIDWVNGTVSGGNNIDDDGNGKIDDVMGWNHYNNNNNSNQTTEANDHGTHVAGCAAAVGNNETGVIGSAPNVKILVSRHAGTAPTGSIYYGNNGIYYCTDTGADIINCSWGGPGGGTTSNIVVTYAKDHGSLVVAAAGNDDLEHNNYYQDYPSDADDAMSVAATDQSDLKTYFSDYGDPIDVSAPGIDIKSTVIGGNGYASYQGTSMASPIAAGVAALVKSVHPEFAPLDIRARIMATTDYIDDLNPDYAGLLGTGRVNAFSATMYDLIPRLEINNYQLTEAEGDGDGVPNPGEIVELRMTFQNSIFSGGFWAAAEDVVVNVESDMAGVTILDGSETFEIPFISQAGVGTHDANPVRFTIPEEENVLSIPFTITIDANPTSEYPYHAVKEINAQMSLFQAGWPYEMGGSSSSSALINNIDGEGMREIVFGGYDKKLHVFTADGSSELNGFPIDFGDNEGTISSAIAAEDINGDGFKEMAVCNEAGYLAVIGQNGEILFDYDAGGQFKANPMIADLDGDGSFEIIAVTFTTSSLIVLNSDGSLYGSSPYTLPAGVMSSAALGDVNNDGTLEIILVTVTGDVHAISGATGSNVGNWPYSMGIGSWNGPIVSNIDEDMEPEIIVGTLNGKVVAINHDATLRFEKTIGVPVKTSVVTGDLDDNGSIEIVFVSSTNGNLYVVDNNGNDLNNFPLNLGVQVESTPILADMDANGTVDIIFGTADGYLHSIDVNGNETPNFPLFMTTEVKMSPAIGDIDNDGDPEIAVSNQSAYLLIDYKRAIGNVEWSCFKRDHARKGNAYYETTSSPEDHIPSIATVLGKNYPNPFNPETKIEFTLQQDAKATLEIYNVKGQKVKTLVNNSVSQGYHTVVWNGKDDSNKSVSNGLYFYRLQTDTYDATKKMLLLK